MFNYASLVTKDASNIGIDSGSRRRSAKKWCEWDHALVPNHVFNQSEASRISVSSHFILIWMDPKIKFIPAVILLLKVWENPGKNAATVGED